MQLDFSEQILAKKRPDPKSSAQTPAKPEDRLKGSPKNEPDSAGTKPDAKEKAEKTLNRKDEKKTVKASITFSEKVTTALKKKVEQHNEKHSRKVSLSQLKKVYRRGAGAFSSSSRPGKSRGQWAMARVNTFLRMMAGGKVKDSYRAADQDVAKASSVDVKTLSQKSIAPVDFEEYELIIAASDLVKSNISLAEMDEDYESEDEEEYNEMSEAEKKTLNKPFRLPSGSKKKFGVYVKNEKGNVVMVKFGDPNMEIKRDNPARRKNFRARHNCDNPGPIWKARYWACRFWSKRSVSSLLSEEALSYAVLLEKNSPKDKKKWSACIAQAKQKFDVYPSAYANAWAAKCYKKKGGGWRKISESSEGCGCDSNPDDTVAMNEYQFKINKGKKIEETPEGMIDQMINTKKVKDMEPQNLRINYLKGIFEEFKK